MACPNTDFCPLFAEVKTGPVWRATYCDYDDRFPDCARYRLFQLGARVPITLLPNGKDLGPRR